MIYRTDLRDYKRLKEIIDETKSRMQMRFKSSGHSVAVDRAMSYYSEHGLFKEVTQGISFYEFLEDITANYALMKDSIISKLKDLLEIIFAKNKLLVSITADDEGYGLFTQSLASFIRGLREKAPEKLLAGYGSLSLIPKCLNEGFKAAIQVQ